MELRLVINIIGCLFFILIEESVHKKRQNEVVHLSYNLLEDKVDMKQSLIINNQMNFYVGTEHFVALDSVSGLNINDLSKLKILTIKEFNVQEMKERKSRIDSVNKKVTILYKDQIFDTIYLYRLKEDSSIVRYNVKWLEEI